MSDQAAALAETICAEIGPWFVENRGIGFGSMEPQFQYTWRLPNQQEDAFTAWHTVQIAVTASQPELFGFSFVRFFASADAIFNIPVPRGRELSDFMFELSEFVNGFHVPLAAASVGWTEYPSEEPTCEVKLDSQVALAQAGDDRCRVDVSVLDLTALSVLLYAAGIGAEVKQRYGGSFPEEPAP